MAAKAKAKVKWKFKEDFQYTAIQIYPCDGSLVICDKDGNELYLSADEAVKVAARIYEVVEEV